MRTEKTHLTKRFVLNGAIRFGTLTFTDARLQPMEKTFVHVAYCTHDDASIDIVNEFYDVLFTLHAGQVAALLSTRAQQSPRFVTKGSIKFNGYRYFHPALDAYSGRTVLVRFNEPTDTDLIIVTEDMIFIVTIKQVAA